MNRSSTNVAASLRPTGRKAALLGAAAVALAVTAGIFLAANEQTQARGSSAETPALAAAVVQLAVEAGPGRDPRALATLRRAAESGRAEAQQALGTLLIERANAATQAPDRDAAADGLHWLRAAAAQGDAEAMLWLGRVHLGALAGRPRDVARAAEWFERAAARGNASAALQRALMARRGDGTRVDLPAAARWLAQAARAGEPQAIFLLANAYREGEGVPRDQVRALALYRQAAELEYPPAHQTLAIAYLYGELGTPRDAAHYQEAIAETAHSLKHPPVSR